MFLQDDPLSALDAHVGKHVFEDAIVKRLVRRKRTVILVSHQLQYISHSNHVSSHSNHVSSHSNHISSHSNHIS